MPPDRFGKLAQRDAEAMHGLHDDLVAIGDHEIFPLASADDLFWRYAAVQHSNPALHRAPVFDLLAEGYSASLFMGLRRLNDPRNDVRSLRRVLRTLGNIAARLDSGWWRSRFVVRPVCWVTKPSEIAEQIIEANERCEHDDVYVAMTMGLDLAAAVDLQQARLDRALAVAKTIANKRYAHHDKERSLPTATFLDIRTALATACDVFDWCTLLVDRCAHMRFVPVELFDVYAGMRTPWLRAGSAEPAHRSIDELIAEVRAASRNAATP